jgi:hypothetical protein
MDFLGKSQKFVVDDENDTLLFKRLQEHVLEHYPNPDRVGCFDRETLVKFVETPGKLNLEDPQYMHIFQCAECTRELMELRELREGRMTQAAQARRREPIRGWQFAGIAALVAVVGAVAFIGWRDYSRRSVETARDLQPVPVLVDLSADGVARGADQSQMEPTVTLPACRVNMHLILPFYSPGGNYRITISRDRSLSHVEAQGSALASVNGSHSELTVQLDLINLAPGSYFMGTVREDDGGPYYYPAMVRR